MKINIKPPASPNKEKSRKAENYIANKIRLRR